MVLEQNVEIDRHYHSKVPGFHKLLSMAFILMFEPISKKEIRRWNGSGLVTLPGRAIIASRTMFYSGTLRF